MRSRASKYNARRTPCRQGKTHASALEARRCDELHLMQAAGEITDLRAHPQPRYKLVIDGDVVGEYRGDFQYFARRAEETVTEDCKGYLNPRDAATRLYRLKAALFRVIYGRRIVEVRAAR